MLLGAPRHMEVLIEPAITGVGASVSMVFEYEYRSRAVLHRTSLAKTPTTASNSGTQSRFEIDGDSCVPATLRTISRDGEVGEFAIATTGRVLDD